MVREFGGKTIFVQSQYPSLMKRLCIFAAILLAFTPVYGSDWEMRADSLAESTKARAERLLLQWTDALLSLQIREGEEAGNVSCPACGIVHGRIIDTVWPLTWLWQRTSDSRYLDAARAAVSWGEKHMQQSDGSYKNDYNSNWRGITEFSQISLGKTLLRFKDMLPEDLCEAWNDLFLRQTEYIYRWAQGPRGNLNVNYQAARPLCMELAWRITGEERFREMALAQSKSIVEHIGPDGIFFGETHPSDYLSPRGLRGVDIGYNVEESFPLLLEYAEMAGEGAMLEQLLRSAAAHLDFILPDGGLDNSFGTRSNKWSYWGSRTSDGILPMLSALCRHGWPEALRAAEYTLALYERCTGADGLLCGGLYYGQAGEPACVHHAFCHIKPLPDWIDTDFSALGDTRCPPLLSETAFGIKHIPSRDVYLLGTRNWRATVNNADNWFNRESQTTAGGSISLLYHHKTGVLLAGTSMVYKTDEPQNMQYQKHETTTRSFTPRLEDGAFSNVYDKDAHISVKGGKRRITVDVEGVLTDENGQKGAPFHLQYKLAGNSLRITVKGQGRFILPVICTPSDEPSAIRIRSQAGLYVETTARSDGYAFTPIAGLMGKYYILPVERKMARLTLRVKNRPATIF